MRSFVLILILQMIFSFDAFASMSQSMPQSIPQSLVQSKTQPSDKTVVSSDFQSSRSKLPAVSSPRLPLFFEQNKGQHDRNFQFVAQTAFSRFAFSNDRVFIQLKDKASGKPKQIALVIQGAEQSVNITGKSKSNYKVNYLRGSKSQWREAIDTFSEIVYHEIYPGIDLIFYFKESRLEYDFIVKAGVDPSIIRFKYDNVNDIRISADEALQISVGGSDKQQNDQKYIQQKAPVIYQLENGERRHVPGRYVQTAETFAFNVDAYDKSKTLVIDPVIEFSSYFGGDWEDYANSVATDSAGNIFIAGSTSAQARITVDNIMTLEHAAMPPLEDTINPTFYDGTHGLSLDPEFATGSQIDLNANKKIVNGVEQSEPFVYACDYVYKGFFKNDSMVTDYDAFISKFDNNFVPIYTTYYGGCRNDGIRDLVIDANNNVYVAGFTLSDNLPIKSASQVEIGPSRFPTEPRQSDAFYAKFDNNGDLIYSSYLGGNGRDGARGIAVDESGYLYITGYTHSSDLSTCPVSSTPVIGCESIGGIELVTEKITGQEISLYSDAFVAKVSPTGDALSFITYFGGSRDDWGQSIVLHKDGVYISGNTSSPDLLAPTSGYSYSSYKASDRLCSRVLGAEDASVPPSDAHFCEDIYLAKISTDGKEIYFSTYLGGELDDNVSDMAVDHQGNIYLVGTSRSKGGRLEKGTALEIDEKIQKQLDENKLTPDQAKEEAKLLGARFPLYKNINDFEFDPDSTFSMTFLTIFNIDNPVSVTGPILSEPVADKLLLSAFIGGENDDSGIALALNDNPALDIIDLYVGGHTLSDNFFTKSAFQKKANNSELFVVKLKLDLSKKDEAYETNPNLTPFTCNVNACDLYDIQYSTLLGGEYLDALKGLHYSTSAGSLFLVGTTYSTLFPITSNALKSQISEVKITDYTPYTRSVRYQEPYYPSEAFLLKMLDTELTADLSLNGAITNTGSIHEGDKIKYDLVITNNSLSVDAKSVRINISFPFLAPNETIKNYASVVNAERCEMEYKQIYCVIGDLAFLQSKTVNVSLQPRTTGNFLVTFSLMSQTADSDLTNNSKEIPSRIRVVPDSGSLESGTLGLLLALMLGSFFSSRYFSTSRQ